MRTVVFLVCLLAIAAPVYGQDCSGWNNAHLSGTYTMSGRGYTDLSQLLPGMGLPSGTLPMLWVGAFVFDGRGGGSGWTVLNVAGMPINVQLVNVKYAMQTDCSVQLFFSMKLKDLGITFGPFPHVMIVIPKPGALELHLMSIGSGTPVKPDSTYELGVAYRIAMN